MEGGRARSRQTTKKTTHSPNPKSKASPRAPPQPPKSALQLSLISISERVVRMIMKGKLRINQQQLNFTRDQSVDNLKNKQWLHEKFERQWSERQKQWRNRELKHFAQKRNRLDFEELKTHEERLQEMHRALEEKRLERLETERKFIEMQEKYYKPSRFAQKLRREEEEEKEHSWEKEMRRKILKEKRKEYSKAVRNALLPPLTTKRTKKENRPIDFDISAIHVDRTFALPKDQVVKLGNYYLQQAKKVVKSRQKLQPLKLIPLLPKQRIVDHCFTTPRLPRLPRLTTPKKPSTHRHQQPNDSDIQIIGSTVTWLR